MHCEEDDTQICQIYHLVERYHWEWRTLRDLFFWADWKNEERSYL